VLPSRAAAPVLAAGLAPVVVTCPTSELNLRVIKNKLLQIKKKVTATNNNKLVPFKYLTMLTKHVGDEGRPSRTLSLGLSNSKLRPIRAIIDFGIIGVEVSQLTFTTT
jgi:hypothetical protein